MLRHFLKVTLRNLRKHKGFTFINVAGLAVGMAFAILILLWVRYEVSHDRFHANLDRLHMVAFTNENRDFFGDATVGALAEYLQEEYPEIALATRVSFPETWGLRYEGDKYYGRTRYVDPAFFAMFDFPFVSGDPETALAEPNSMVVTEEFADRVFGRHDPLGKTIRGIRGVDYTVTAVVKEIPRNSRFRGDCFIPAEYGPEAYRQWDIKCLQTFVMLEAGEDHENVSEPIADVYNIHNDGTRNDQYLVPLADAHLYSLDGSGGTIVFVMIFSIIGAAVLLIACINFVNLSTARSDVRYREIGVKKVIGARQLQLAGQFLGESILLSFLALIFSVVLLEWMIPMVNGALSLQLALDFSWQTVLTLTGVALITGIVSGCYPAVYLSSLKPVAVLGRQRLGSGARGGLGMRRILVVAQFTITVIFIVGVIIIFKQLNHVRTMDMGFEKDSVVLFNLPGELVSRAQMLKGELLKHPGVESVTVSTGGLVSWNTSFGIDWEGEQPDQVFDVGFNRVDQDYLETFRMEMVEGRFFSKEFPSDLTDSLVVNEALVASMGVEDPVGRRIVGAAGSSMEQSGTIIGVIKNYHTETAHKEIRPFMLGLSETGYLMCARIGREDVSGTLGFIRTTIKDIVPDAGVYTRFFNEELSSRYQVELLTGSVIVFIAMIAIVISCLGLFGLTAYTARRRTREIGIRKVLGASVSSILGLFAKEIVLLVLIAGALGCTISYFVMRRWLESFVYRTALDPWSFGSVIVLLLAIALGTVILQAMRAATANPVDAIRQE